MYPCRMDALYLDCASAHILAVVCRQLGQDVTIGGNLVKGPMESLCFLKLHANLIFFQNKKINLKMETK